MHRYDTILGFVQRVNSSNQQNEKMMHSQTEEGMGKGAQEEEGKRECAQQQQ